MFYSKSTNGFYSIDIHGDKIPADSVEISEAEYQILINGQYDGKSIVPNEEGLPTLQEPPPPTVKQIVLSLTEGVQEYMDSIAQSFGYDDIKSAVTYADEPSVAKFQAEGQALRAWRSLCWEYCYSVMDAVESGERTQPTLDDLIAGLPSFSM